MLKNLINNRYFSSFTWIFFERILLSCTNFIVGLILTRHLGPEKFGVVSYALAFVFLFSFISSLGLNSIVVRQLTREPDQYYEIISTTICLKLIGAIFSIILGAICTYFLVTDDTDLTFIIYVLLLTYIFKSADVFDCYFQSKVLAKYSVISRYVAIILTSFLKLMFIYLNLEIIFLSAIFLTESIIYCITITCFFNYLGLNKRRFKFNYKLGASLLRDIWPLMLSSLCVIIYIKIDQIMIESLMNIQFVGIYAVSVTLAELWYFIPMAIVTILTPYFIKLRDENIDLYLYKLKLMNTIMFWLSASVGIFITIYGRELISFMYGDAFSEAFVALSVNIWAGIFVSLGLVSNFWIIAENLQKYRLIVTICCVLINIIGNWILIPRYCISGAATASLVSQCIWLWVIPLFIAPLRKKTFLSISSIVPLYLLYPRQKL